jgi:hypothetical protein
VNWQHFQAFLWLRWRLFANQMTRGGILSQILLAMLAVGAGFLAIVLLIASFLAGFFLLPQAPPIAVLLVWDGLVFFFLVSWCTGLITELQRSESLSLDKFLHLPVSLSGVFTLNYLSSLACATIILQVPTMLGLSLGLTLGKGPLLALQLPAAAAFVFMVTALSYQFQGWLAALMVNKRRRRTIIVIVSVIFVLIFQVPNLVNIVRPWKSYEEQNKGQVAQQDAELDRALKANEITIEEFHNRRMEMMRERAARGTDTLKWWQDFAWIANMALPLGWLPWGAAGAMEDNPLPGLLATLIYTLIGAASLWRAYRTTLRIYTGQFTGQPAVAAVSKQPRPALPTADSAAPTANAAFLEKTIPWLSEQAAVIALTGFRSLTRAPEVKLLLLSPIGIVVVFGALFLRGGVEMPEAFRPLAAYGAMVTILFSFSQLVGNQFGYDRNGFRIFMLSPVPRREILLGKNLALVPLLFGLGAPVVAVVTIFIPLRYDQLLALPFQFVSMFLIYCMAANLLSILAPMPVAVGSLKPLTPKMVPMLLHMIFMLAMPIALTPVLAPWGIAAALEALDLSWSMPIYPVLAVLECAAIIGLFRVVLRWEGDLLQTREQQILEAVVAKAE